MSCVMHMNESCQRAAKDISLKIENELCTTKAKIPPRKAIFPVLAILIFGGGVIRGRKIELYNYYQHCTIIFYTTAFSVQLVVICQKRKIQTRTTPKGPPKMETNVQFKKLLRDFKESALGIYIYLSSSKRDL